MRIAIFIGGFLPLYNGVVSYVIDIGTELSKRGHTVVVFAPKQKRGVKINISQYPFKVIQFPSFPAIVYPELRFTFPAFPTIVKELRLFHPDVVHTNDPMSICTEGIAAAKLLHIPTVITYHTFLFDKDMMKNLRFGEALFLFKQPLSVLNARYHNIANAVICPSEEAQRELVHYGLQKPSYVINNGINLVSAQAAPLAGLDPLKKELRIVSQTRVAVFTGRLSADKKIDVLISAWPYVIRSFPNAKLLIIGKGPCEDALRQQTQNLGIEQQVIFTGGIAREEIFRDGYYKLAHMFVSASAIENQSVAMIEAMANGLPLICVKMRGTEELIQPAFGMLVSPDNPTALAAAILKVMSQDTLRAAMSKAARLQSMQYDIRVTIRQVEHVYMRVIREQRDKNEPIDDKKMETKIQKMLKKFHALNL